MEFRQLGTSEVEVSAITFGAWAIGGFMWGRLDDGNAIRAIQTSIDAGVTSIDTAPIYGCGHSEDLVGRAIRGRRDKVQILTKFGLRWDGQGTHVFEMPDPTGRTVRVSKSAKRPQVIEECEQSLRRLGVDYLDLYQHHRPDENTPIEESMEAAARLLEQGKVRAVGVSNYSIEQMDRARRVVNLASTQPPYNMVSREIESEIIPYCLAHKVGVIVYSPLQRGLLTGKYKPDVKFPESDHRAKNPYFRPENIRRVNAFLEEIRPIADAHRATLGQLVINWTLRQKGVTAALVGARDSEQAAENAQATAFTLTADELQRINELLEGLTLEL